MIQKAFSNVNSKQKDVKQEVDANEKKRYEIALENRSVLKR